MLQLKTSDEQIHQRFVSMLMTMSKSSNKRIKFIASRGVSLENTTNEEKISYVKCKLGENIAKNSCLFKGHLFVFTIMMKMTYVQKTDF